MYAIIAWILSVAFSSFSTWYYKKALDQWKWLSNTMFKVIAFATNFISIPIVIFFLGFEKNILWDYYIILLVFISSLIWWLNSQIELNIFKVSKLSELMPYNNLNKLFVIVIWFFLFYWTKNWSSVITLIIAILTLILTFIFTVDFRNIKIPKTIILYVISKFISSLTVLLTWYILINYSSATIYSISWVTDCIIYVWLWIILRQSFKSMLQQEKWFYISRFLATTFWWTSSLLTLIVLKEAWVVLATLLWFFSVVFMTFSMKFILHDNPTIKQIIMSSIIILFIWIWYYFK